MMSLITEHSSKIQITFPEKDVHRKMDVFYNPLMASQRSITILLLNSLEKKEMNIADPLAGSGIRALRFMQELKSNKIRHLFVNDLKETFQKTFTQNIELNNLKKSTNIHLSTEDASLFLLNQVHHCKDIEKYCGYFDYIEIDPFGTPNPFLNAAIARINRHGLVAVTATDTAALTGTYPKVTQRKYWAKSLKNYLMHELGLRILIRKIQLIGIQFDKALIPILAYHKDHYFRIFFISEKGKEKCDTLVKRHQYFLFNPESLEFTTSFYNQQNGFEFAGPLWTGNLSDKKLIQKMAKENPFPEEQKFLDLLKEEARIDQVGFYDLHSFARKYKMDAPKMDFVLSKVHGVRTHFSGTGIKTKCPFNEIKKLFSSIHF